MALRIYADKKDINIVPVTQNEEGVYYEYDSGSLWKPILKDFDSAKGKPSTAHKKINGSHVQNPSLNRIDFSLVGKTKMTASLLGHINLIDKWGVLVDFGSGRVVKFNHCTTTLKLGAIVKAGDVICTVNTLAQNKVDLPPNGFPEHLEIYIQGGKIRDQILAPIESKPPATVPEIKPTVVIPEDVYHKLLAKEADDAVAIEALRDLLTINKKAIEDIEKKLNNKEQEYSKVVEDVNSITTTLANSAYTIEEQKIKPVVYSTTEDWDIQKYKYEGIIAKIRDEVIGKTSVRELLKVAINKLFGLKND